MTILVINLTNFSYKLKSAFLNIKIIWNNYNNTEKKFLVTKNIFSF